MKGINFVYLYMQKIYLFILSSIYLVSFAGNGIVFKENKNQWPSNVLFGADYKSTHFFVNTDGFNFCIYDGNDLYKAHQASHDKKNSEEETAPINLSKIKGHNYSVVFNNASFLKVNKINPLTEYYNYFIGNDKSKWAGNVKAYEELLFSSIYPNIDLKLYSNNSNVKYDLIVKPHADIRQIQLNYKDIDGLAIKNGNLIIATSVGNMIEQKPYAYQIIKGKKIEVVCHYVLKNNNTIVYELPNGYNTNYELIIDPTIVVCSYSNSAVWSNCYGASYDDIGNVFVMGFVDVGYPTTVGAFQIVSDSMFDAVITKYNSSGNTKIFSTYLGGNGQDILQNIVITNNDITIFGITHSTNFPVTINAYDTSYNDTIANYSDFFVSKLDLTGSSFFASTYIGGSNDDGINVLSAGGYGGHIGNMVIDAQGNVYVCSSTNSLDFPVTTNAFQIIKNTGVANIAFKLDPTLQTLIYSTYFGGSSHENAYSSKIVNSNELLISGTTLSVDFPSTPGSFNPVKNTGRDMYVLHLNASGTGVIASTFLGTSGSDFGYFIDTDLNNDVYLCGYIGSPTTFTSTPGLYNIPTAKSVIIKLTSNLSSVVYQTKFGTPTIYDYTAFKVDSCQNIYISGFASGSNYPVTADKFQNYNHGTDLYVTVFSANMLSLKFASFFGGKDDEHTDGGNSYFNDKGILYQGICINKGNMPTTTGAFQASFPTLDTMIYNDAFIKIDFQNFVKTNSSYGPTVKACPPFTANFNSFTNTGTNSWNFGDGSPISNQQNTTHTYNSLGNYTVSLIANDSTTCNKTDTVKSIVAIVNPSQLKITGNPIICENQPAILKIETNDAVSYSWSTGATTSSISINTEGTYTATINNGGCDTKQTIDITYAQTNIGEQFPNVITPNNDGANDVINFSKYNFTKVLFTVFDRWGIEKYKTNKTDAVFNPASYTDGTYFYTLDYQTACDDSHIKTKGFITVLK